nr:PAS domain S-box protein [Nocardioidaceae bacterium]
MTPPVLWDISKLRQLQELVGRLNAGGSLAETLQGVVDGVVEVAGFEVASINHLQSDGMWQCIAVAGSDAARTQLLGVRQPRAVFDAEFAASERWGSLRFVPHERMPADVSPGWIPDLNLSDDPDAWHPHDALFAPLHSPGGDLIGVLSVDLPHDRRRPGPFQREILQMYAAHAGIAIYRAQLMDQLIENEQAFRLAFENAGIGMAVLSLKANESSRYLRANTAFCHLVGFTEKELKTMSTADLTHPDDRDTDLVNIDKAVTTDQRVFEVEKRFQHAGGGSVWVAVTTSVIEDANGHPVSAISQVQD